MNNDSNTRADSTGEPLALLDAYRDTVERLFPVLTRYRLDSLSVSAADALFVGHFLDAYPRRVPVFERGVALGSATFLLASHPKVSKVLGTDPNPSIGKSVPSDSDDLEGSGAMESLESLKVLDVAHAVLAEHAAVRWKVTLHESKQDSTTTPGLAEESADGDVIVLINDARGREDVYEELAALFDAHPQSIAFIGNCRGGRGPFVQAGVADFLEKTRDDYRFRLGSDLGFGLADSILGVIYAGQAAAEMNEVLGEISGRFSERLDPLQLLQREEELLESVNATKRELDRTRKINSELNNRLSSLTQRNKHLENHYSSRRYKLADAAMDKAQRVKSLKRFMR